MSTYDCDLLVVGLGPVGDTLAALGRIHGLSVIAIDRALAPHPLPRAAIVDHEIMRIMQMIGVAERVSADMRAPQHYQFLTARGEILLNFPIAERGPYGWSEAYAFHQPSFEATIRDRMVELGVDIRMGVSFTSLVQDASGVTVSTEKDCHSGTIRARFVVGCDGGASPVRQSLDIGLHDFQFDEPWLVIDGLLDTEHALPVVAQQICDPKRPVTHLAMNAGRYRWEFMIKPGENPEAVLDDVFIRGLLSPWDRADHIRIERKAVYRFHGLIAEEWRRGRVLIAGDAAHQMPPFAGQGMCSGIRDAANLAWKIAAVVTAAASEEILDSYQAERAPHARAIIETAIAMGRVVCMLDVAEAAERDAGMLARKAAGAQDVSTAYPDLQGGLLTTTTHAGALLPQPSVGELRLDDVLGHGAVLIGRDLPSSHPSVSLLELGSPNLVPFATWMSGWLDELGCDAVLVRPDRYIFGVGAARMLIDQWDALIGTRMDA